MGKTEQFAEQHDLRRPRHTLVPRAGLLNMILPELRRAGATEMVDMTIAYPQTSEVLQSKWNLKEFGTLKEQPFDVYVDIRIFPLDYFGSSTEDVQKCLSKIYEGKDDLLDHHGTQGSFPHTQPLVVPIRWWSVQVLIWTMLLYFCFAFFKTATIAVFAIAARRPIFTLSAFGTFVATAVSWRREPTPVPESLSRPFCFACLALFCAASLSACDV